MELDAKRNISSLSRNNYSRNIQSNKTTHAHNQDEQMRKYFKNTLYQLQHLDKQVQDNSIDNLHFKVIFVPIWTSVPLNEDRKLEQNEHCIVRAPISIGKQFP